MAKRSRVLSAAPFEGGKPNEVLVVEVSYSEGGSSLWSGKVEPRGYWLLVRPEKREGGTRSFIVGEGSKAFLAQAKRFSEKRLALVPVDPDLIAKLVARVVAERQEQRRESVAAHAEQGGGVP